MDILPILILICLSFKSTGCTFH